MADFCGNCELEVWNELTPRDDLKPGDRDTILCEGCEAMVEVDHTGLRVSCDLCVHGHEGVCEHVAGDNFGHTTEISGLWSCNNFVRRVEHMQEIWPAMVVGVCLLLGLLIIVIAGIMQLIK